MNLIGLIGMLIVTAVAPGPRLNWETFHEPAYPQMARVANIEGTVTVDLAFAPDGSVAIQPKAGHPVLVQSAVESLKLSKITCENCEQSAARFSVVFQFKIDKSECGNSTDSPRVVLEASNNVTITIDRFCFVDLPPVLGKKVRSIRCLYLWKCAVGRD